MKKQITKTIFFLLLLLGVSPMVNAQARIQPDDRRVEKQYRVHGRVSRHNQKRYKDRFGLRSSEFSYDAHYLGGWIDGDYARIFHSIPQTKHLGGYSIGSGIAYEFRSSYFLLHTGIGVRWMEVRDSVPNVYLNNMDMLSLSGDYRWQNMKDSYGVPINSLNYAFTKRVDYIRSLTLELPVMFGFKYEGFYCLAGFKFGFGLFGRSRATTYVTTTASYEERYIGIYGEMDNHGYRKDVPISSATHNTALKRFDIAPAIEIGYDWRVEDWHFRLAAYADYGLMNLNPGSSLKQIEVPYDSRFDFDTFVLNPVYTSPTAVAQPMHNFNAGLRFVFIYEFPQRVHGVVGKHYKIRGRRY